MIWFLILSLLISPLACDHTDLSGEDLSFLSFTKYVLKSSDILLYKQAGFGNTNV